MTSRSADDEEDEATGSEVEDVVDASFFLKLIHHQLLPLARSLLDFKRFKFAVITPGSLSVTNLGCEASIFLCFCNLLLVSSANCEKTKKTKKMKKIRQQKQVSLTH